MSDSRDQAASNYKIPGAGLGLSIAQANDIHDIFTGRNTAGDYAFHVQLRFSSLGQYQVNADIRDNAAGHHTTAWYAISDASHFIEIEWFAATAPGANNGYLSLWIDGALKETVSGINNDARRVDEVRLGPNGGLDAGTSGTEYFDAFESRRATYIGPVSSGSLVTTTITYTYDPLSRLTDATYSNGQRFQYAYDAVGNRTVQTRTITSTQVITYGYDNANRMTKAGGITYTWDNNGNLTNDGTATYLYDRANRMISTTVGSVTTQFSYNGDGARLKQIANGVVTTYTQDLAAPLPVVLQAKTGTSTTKYLYSLGTRPLAQNSTAWEYLLPDALGSVRQIVDANGNVTLAKSYEPYGTVLTSTGTASSIFGYSGEEVDTTGLIYLRARYMNPWLGIFLARDPWSGDQMRPGSMNGFDNVEGNPVNRVDPSGNGIDCLVDIARGELSTLYGIELRAGAFTFASDEICVIHDTVNEYANLLGGPESLKRNLDLSVVIANWATSDPADFDATYNPHENSITLPPNWLHDVLMLAPGGDYFILMKQPCLEERLHFPPGSLPNGESEAKFVLAHEMGHAFNKGNPVSLQSFEDSVFAPVGDVIEGMILLANPLIVRNMGRSKGEVFADAIAAYLYSPGLLHKRMTDWVENDMPAILK